MELILGLLCGCPHFAFSAFFVPSLVSVKLRLVVDCFCLFGQWLRVPSRPWCGRLYGWHLLLVACVDHGAGTGLSWYYPNRFPPGSIPFRLLSFLPCPEITRKTGLFLQPGVFVLAFLFSSHGFLSSPKWLLVASSLPGRWKGLEGRV